MKYFINYGIGTGDKFVEGTLADAMHAADKGATCTKQDIKIYFTSDWNDLGPAALHLAIRRWLGVKYKPVEGDVTAEDIISFGETGYYFAWFVREDDEPRVRVEHRHCYEWKLYTHDMY